MSSVIHYKLKMGASMGASSSIHFDGIYLSCFELKQRIIYAEGMMRSIGDANFDLLVTNSQNAEDYRDDAYSIHRNVSVVVKKVPPPSPAYAQRLFIAPGSLGEDWNKSTSTWTPGGGDNANLTPLGASGGMHGGAEDDGVAAALNAASKYSGGPRTGPPRGAFQGTARGALTANSRPPTGYTCHRCKQSGHYIQFCATNGDSNYDLGRRGATTREDREKERASERERERERDSRQSGGYGRDSGSQHMSAASNEKHAAWLRPVEDPKALSEGGASASAASAKGPSKFIYSSGFFSSTTTGAGQVAHVQAAPQVSSSQSLQYFIDPSINPTHAPAAAPAPSPATPSSAMATLRPDLTCSLCKDYFVSAQCVGCCFTSYCDECIRAHFQSSPSCPSCSSSEAEAMADLEANFTLQKAVDTFLREHPEIEPGAIKRARAPPAAAVTPAAPPASVPAPVVKPESPVSAEPLPTPHAIYQAPSNSTAYGAPPSNASYPQGYPQPPTSNPTAYAPAPLPAGYPQPPPGSYPPQSYPQQPPQSQPPQNGGGAPVHDVRDVRSQNGPRDVRNVGANGNGAGPNGYAAAAAPGYGGYPGYPPMPMPGYGHPAMHMYPPPQQQQQQMYPPPYGYPYQQPPSQPQPQSHDSHKRHAPSSDDRDHKRSRNEA